MPASAEFYRPIYSRIVDDLDFQALSVDAKLVWYTLRVCPECGPVGVFRFYPALFVARTGLSASKFDAAISLLEASRYVIISSGYIYLRNAMRFEPNYRPSDDEKHRKNLFSQLEPISHLDIVWMLLEDNGIDIPEGWENKGHRRVIEGPSKAHRSSESESESESDSCRARRSASARVTAHYIDRFGRHSYELTPKRRKILDDALSIAEADVLCEAIDLYRDHPAFSDQRENRFDGLCEYILRKGERVGIVERLDWIFRRAGKELIFENAKES